MPWNWSIINLSDGAAVMRLTCERRSNLSYDFRREGEVRPQLDSNRKVIQISMKVFWKSQFEFVFISFLRLVAELETLVFLQIMLCAVCRLIDCKHFANTIA